MKTRSRIASVPIGALRLVGGIAIAVVLAACTASIASPSPSSSPTASGPAAASASPSSEVTPAESAGPSRIPQPSATAVVTKPGWNQAGTMLVGETGFQATALADGRVLVVYGSWDPAAPARARAEVWDPSTNTWTATTGFNKQRTEFALVSLKDGRVLVAGGLNDGGHYTGQSYSSACVFDLRAGHDGCEATGLMTVARAAPSAVVLPDGRVLVAGGYFNTGVSTGSVDDPTGGLVLAGYRSGGVGTGPSGPRLDDVVEDLHGYALATAEVFDPATGKWASTGSMHYARVAAPMIVLSDGRVLVVGSTDSAVVGVHSDAYVTAEIYDPATGRFTLAGRLPAIDHAAVKAEGVALPNGEGDPGPMGTLVSLPGGAVLVGNDRWWKHMAEVVRTFRYDTTANAWRQVGQACASATDDPASGKLDRTATSCRIGDLSVPLPDGRLLSLGGWVLGREQTPADGATALIVDPLTGRETSLPRMPDGRSLARAAVLADGSVLIMGGIGSDGEYAKSALRYVPG